MEDITILIPTWNRSKWNPLILLNLKLQDYPHDKLKVIIDDDSDTDKQFKISEELEEFKRVLHPIQITYIDNKPKRSIGKKRNDLIKECTTKIFCFMDTDDIYINTYISHSYQTLKEKNVGCVGSDKMLFCMTDRNFDLHAIDCGDRAHLIHEATIMATKKWFKSSCGFSNNSVGEGKELFTGIKNVAITEIGKIMCCVQHKNNSVEKLQFAKEENKLTFQIADAYKDLLKNILELE
mgnify:FL=1|tara:strand:- start:84 stop:794 length:711 start_codon:yes stop_codon:yes gene_type:complete